MSKIVTVQFELAVPDNFKDADTLPKGVHEALCLSVYEQDDEAISWLMQHVTDIKVMDQVIEGEFEG